MQPGSNHNEPKVVAAATSPTVNAFPQTTLLPESQPTNNGYQEDIADVLQQQNRQLRTLYGAIPNSQAISALIAQLPNPSYDAQAKRSIQAAVNAGNPNRLRALNRGNTAAFARLEQIARAINAVNNLRNKARNGTVTPSDLRNVVNALQPFTSTNSQLNNRVQSALSGLLNSSNTLARLLRVSYQRCKSPVHRLRLETSRPAVAEVAAEVWAAECPPHGPGNRPLRDPRPPRLHNPRHAWPQTRIPRQPERRSS